MFTLAWLLVSDLPAYRATVILVGLARHIAMVLIRTDLASGAQETGALLAALNATVFQVVAYAHWPRSTQRPAADARIPASTGLLPLRPRDLLGAELEHGPSPVLAGFVLTLVSKRKPAIGLASVSKGTAPTLSPAEPPTTALRLGGTAVWHGVSWRRRS
jgi:Sodium Bile acid symporter family